MNTENIKKYLENEMVNPLSFEKYMAFFENLVAEGKTNWPTQDEFMIHYTKLNLSRTKRILKTHTLNKNWESINIEKGSIKAVTLTEPWCGDAAQNLPILQLILEKFEIEHTLLLRDENPGLMNELLTNGGKAIPKTVFIDAESNFPLFEWGARPEKAQQIVEDYKNAPEPKMPYTEFTEILHKWYNENKGQDMELELIELFETFSEEI